jgi:hypothetical protein
MIIDEVMWCNAKMTDGTKIDFRQIRYMDHMYRTLHSACSEWIL